MLNENLIKDCLKQDRNAQSRLFNLLAPKLMGVCVRYMVNHQDAQDVLQDGFIKIFQNLHKFQFKGSFEGWARKIIVNKALETLRKNHALKWSDDIDNHYDLKNYDEDAIDYLNRKELLEIIHKIPLGYRTVFNMFAIEGYSHKEIADSLSITEGTSKSQFARAKKFIQQEIIKSEKIVYHE